MLNSPPAGLRELSERSREIFRHIVTAYVGTGEPDIRSQHSYGIGMFKSTDAGKTWTHIGLEATRQIGRVAVDPANPNRVYVAALGETPSLGVEPVDLGSRPAGEVFLVVAVGKIISSYRPRRAG